jgi:imidazolonepropionase
MQEERGTLAPGKAADFVVWAIRQPEELGYWTGFNPCRAVIRGGQVVSRSA